MAELMFPNLADSFMRGQEVGTQQRLRREGEERRSGLAALARQAYGADPSQRNALVGQAMGIDAQGGAQLAGTLANDEERRTKSMVNMARMLTSAPEQYRPSLYQQMIPTLQRSGLSQLPPQYDETVAEAAQAIVQAYGGASDQQRNLAVSPGSALVNPQTGQVVYERPFSPSKPQLIQTADGYAWATPEGASPLNYGGGQSAPAAAPSGGSPDGLTQFTGADGQPVRIGNDLPPHLVQQILSQPEEWAGAPDGASARLPDSSVSQMGGNQRVMPVPKGPGAAFAPVGPDEIRQLGLPEGTVAQRNATTGEVKVVSAPPVATAAQSAKAAEALRQRSATLRQYEVAMQGLRGGLEEADTGPIVGRLPAFTANQQIADGAAAAMAPILKQLFRSAGEGTFTDKDQALLLEMVPTRKDRPEARAAKIRNIDNIVRAKLGADGGVGMDFARPAPADAGSDPLGIL